MAKMTCLVLGGAGFIGSHLVDALVTRGHEVRIFDRPRIDTRNLSQVMHHVELISGDISNESDIADALEGMETLVHLVSTTLPATSNANPVFDIETNLAGTVRLLELARNAGVKKIVFASSGGTVYGAPLILPVPESHPTDPTCSYGITKLAIEKYLQLFYQLYGLDYSILRIANPYGERQNPVGGVGAVTAFLCKAIKGDPITIWGNGEVARDYLYITDLVNAFLDVIEKDHSSKIYNIGSGKAHSLNEIVTMIKNVTGLAASVEFTPARKFDVSINFLDISLARSELDWTPVITLEEGISKVWKSLIGYKGHV